MMIDLKIYSSRYGPSHKTVGLRESISFGNDLLTINEMKKIIRKVWIENNDDIKQLDPPQEFLWPRENFWFIPEWTRK